MASPEAEKLPKSLYEAAIVHQQNPGASIAELGSLMNPPISKSGMNHRLSRLIEIAESM
jgi:DNA-binding protein WhiA